MPKNEHLGDPGPGPDRVEFTRSGPELTDIEFVYFFPARLGAGTRVRGTRTALALLQSQGMSRFEAARYLCELHERMPR